MRFVDKKLSELQRYLSESGLLDEANVVFKMASKSNACDISSLEAGGYEKENFGAGECKIVIPLKDGNPEYPIITQYEKAHDGDSWSEVKTFRGYNEAMDNLGPLKKELIKMRRSPGPIGRGDRIPIYPQDIVGRGNEQTAVKDTIQSLRLPLDEGLDITNVKVLLSGYMQTEMPSVLRAAHAISKARVEPAAQESITLDDIVEAKKKVPPIGELDFNSLFPEGRPMEVTVTKVVMPNASQCRGPDCEDQNIKITVKLPDWNLKDDNPNHRAHPGFNLRSREFVVLREIPIKYAYKIRGALGKNCIMNEDLQYDLTEEQFVDTCFVVRPGASRSAGRELPHDTAPYTSLDREEDKAYVANYFANQIGLIEEKSLARGVCDPNPVDPSNCPDIGSISYENIVITAPSDNSVIGIDDVGISVTLKKDISPEFTVTAFYDALNMAPVSNSTDAYGCSNLAKIGNSFNGSINMRSLRLGGTRGSENQARLWIAIRCGDKVISRSKTIFFKIRNQ